MRIGQVFFVIWILVFVPSGQCEKIRIGIGKQLSAKGDKLWALSPYKQILRRKDDDSWESLGVASQIAACSDGYAWAVNVYDAPKASIVRRYDPNLSNDHKDQWKSVPSKNLRMINCRNANEAVGVGADGRIYQYKPEKKPNPWAPFDDIKDNVLASIGEDGSMWRVNFLGKLFRYANGWQNVAAKEEYGPVKHIDVHSDSRFVVIHAFYDYVYTWDGNQWTYKLMYGQATINMEAIFCISAMGELVMIKPTEEVTTEKATEAVITDKPNEEVTPMPSLL